MKKRVFHPFLVPKKAHFQASVCACMGGGGGGAEPRPPIGWGRPLTSNLGGIGFSPRALVASHCPGGGGGGTGALGWRIRWPVLGHVALVPRVVEGSDSCLNTRLARTPR